MQMLIIEVFMKLSSYDTAIMIKDSIDGVLSCHQ